MYKNKGGNEMDKLLLRPREVTELLGLSRSRVYELLCQGQLPSVRIGRSIRVPSRALTEWVEKQQLEQQRDSTETNQNQ